MKILHVAYTYASVAKGRAFGAGPKGDSQKDIGRSRRALSTENHLRTNEIGLPVTVILSPREASDMTAYGPLMDQPGPNPKTMLADKGCNSN